MNSKKNKKKLKIQISWNLQLIPMSSLSLQAYVGQPGGGGKILNGAQGPNKKYQRERKREREKNGVCGTRYLSYYYYFFLGTFRFDRHVVVSGTGNTA